MQKKPLSDYPEDTVTSLLSGIPFFKDLMVEDEEQFSILMNHASFFSADPGDEIIRKGTKDNTFYFNLRGQLIVYPNDDESRLRAINYLGSGQVFGALAMLCGIERTASIVADPKGNGVLLFGADFSPFGKLDDFSQVNLSTKLAFFRMVVHNTRWKLEVYKMEYPKHPLVEELRKVEVYRGSKDTMEELESLDKQTRQLTDLLQQWNKSFENPGDFKITDNGLVMLGIHTA